MMKKGILGIVIFMLALTASAQEKNGKREAGIRVLYGYNNELLPEGKVYKPLMVLPYYNRYFTKAERRLRFSVMLEEQIVYAVSDYRDSHKKDYDWEFGLNAGPAMSYRISRFFTPYVGAMYGVDFITVKTDLQRNGWILAATGYSGVKSHIGNNLYADVHVRFRHISNGGVKKPNLGIDTWLLGAGISKLF